LVTLVFISVKRYTLILKQVDMMGKEKTG